jgi:hypothetical protein
MRLLSRMRRVDGMQNPPILDEPWPADLDPETVPFKGRTVTVLIRHGFFDNWDLFSELTVNDMSAWWNVGPVTVRDLQATGNAAIKRHHGDTDLLRELDTDLEDVALEPWSVHIWYHDPRFSEYVPKGGSTVHEIATSGSALDRRYLWERLGALRQAVERQAALPLDSAVSQYVEAISGQHSERLEVLLARTGLSGQEPITASQASGMLGVSRARINQIEHQVQRNRQRACPPAGTWMPQVQRVERYRLPNLSTEPGIAAIRSFFESAQLA